MLLLVFLFNMRRCFMNIKEYRLEEDTFEMEEWKLKKDIVN